MSCGNANIELHFETTGMKIRPTQLNLRKNIDQFDHVRCRVSREAGIHIAENHAIKEPVSIISNGSRIGRLFVPDTDDAISVTHKSAFLNLQDELSVFYHTNVDKVFHDGTKLGDVLNYLLMISDEEDPNGIITTWVEQNTDVIDSEEIEDRAGFNSPLLDRLGQWTREKAREYDIARETAGLNFEDISVWEALQIISAEYSVDIFTKNDGVMYIGKPEDESEVYAAGYFDGFLNLVSLSVPKRLDRVRKVTVKGGIPSANITENNSERLRPFGEAVNSNANTDEEIVHEAVDTTNFSDLEEIAERVMRDLMSHNNSGSVTVDALSSESDRFNIKNATIGDTIYIPEHTFCRRDIHESMYLITGIHHKVNNRVGWHITLNVQEIPMGSDITTNSYAFNPVSEEFVGKEDDSIQYNYGTESTREKLVNVASNLDYSKMNRFVPQYNW